MSASQLAEAIEKHFKAKGLAQGHIHPFLRDLLRTIPDYKEAGQVNSRLRLLGWDDMNVDYRTLELAEAYFDSGMVSNELH